MKLILASGSKNRIHALNLAGIPYTSASADIDEKSIQDPDIYTRVVKVAQAKVDAIRQSYPGLVLGADGVNLCQGKVLEKPKDLDEAKYMIQLQSGQRCSFLTGYFLINTYTGKFYQGTSECFYTFRSISKSEIKAYVRREPVTSWAAAFSPANSSAITFIESIEGPFAEFCYSMPFEKLIPIFKIEGIV